MFINFIDGVFFLYIFIGLYMTFFLVLTYLWNRKELFSYPKGKPEPVSIIIPCYNEGKNIGKTIESLLNLDYPKNMIEIIVVDDKSTDNSLKIARSYARKYSNVRVIASRVNSGCAAVPTNMGIRSAKYKYIAVADADSTPDRDALMKMIGFLQKDKKVGAVTCSVLVKNPRNLIQRLQEIEYAVIAWSRKLLDFVDAVYVTPGPFALYRKSTLVDIGMFDKNNLTQDIEIVWRMLSKGYFARMCIATRVYSESPSRFGGWFRQRIRWNMGGIQCLTKYKSLFLRKSILGLFVIPFFAFSMFLGIFGLGLFVFLTGKRLLTTYLTAKYSVYAGSSLLHLSDLSFAPSILNFFGAALLFLSIAFTLFGLSVIKIERPVRRNLFNFSFYAVMYLSVYPVLLIIAIFRMMFGSRKW